jgi:ribonuclease P protein component
VTPHILPSGPVVVNVFLAPRWRGALIERGRAARIGGEGGCDRVDGGTEDGVAKAQGFSREERLRRTGDFDRVFAEGRRRRGSLMSLRWAPNELGHTRLGVALSRRWKGAVRRNRAKRVVREAFRTHKGDLPRGIDLVVLPHLDWGDPAPEAVAAELVRLLGGTRGRNGAVE